MELKKNNKLAYHIVEVLVLKGFADYRENNNINKRKSKQIKNNYNYYI